MFRRIPKLFASLLIISTILCYYKVASFSSLSSSPFAVSLSLYSNNILRRQQQQVQQRQQNEQKQRSRFYAYVNGDDDDDNTIETTTTTTSTTTTATIGTIGIEDPAILSNDSAATTIMECEIRDENVVLKKELLQYAASYDRGYGASPLARQRVDTIIQQLELLNPSINPADSILFNSGSNTNNNNNNNNNGEKTYNYSIRYNWRMIWTSAIDVLSLNANPFFAVGAIYQCFATADDLIITNVIDVLPRIQALLPPSIVPNTLLRLSVRTRAQPPLSTKTDETISSSSLSSSLVKKSNINRNRIGLQFEAVQIEPVELFGQKINIFPPVGWNIPQVPESLFQAQGYFDVTYLDNDLLIIRQNYNLPNNVGGLFVLTKVTSIDP